MSSVKPFSFTPATAIADRPHLVLDKAATCLLVGLRPNAIQVETGTDVVIAKASYAEVALGQVALGGFDLVLTPLVANEFDALDLLEALAEGAFAGTLRVVAPKLPNRLLVLRELQAAARPSGISVELVERP